MNAYINPKTHTDLRRSKGEDQVEPDLLTTGRVEEWGKDPVE